MREIRVLGGALPILVSYAMLVMTGCGSMRHSAAYAGGPQVLPVTDVRHDTVRVSDVRYDSVYIFQDRTLDRMSDTVYLRDARVEYRYHVLHDTVRVIRMDSIPYLITVTEVREVPRERGTLDVVAYGCFGLVASFLLWWLICLVRNFLR